MVSHNGLFNLWWKYGGSSGSKSRNKRDDGGNKNSGDCGYVSDKPNYVLQLNEQAYSLNVILETQAEKPSLLILGPGEGDRFCILGDTKSGKSSNGEYGRQENI